MRSLLFLLENELLKNELLALQNALHIYHSIVMLALPLLVVCSKGGRIKIRRLIESSRVR